MERKTWSQSKYLSWLAESGWLRRLTRNELRVLIVMTNYCWDKPTCWPSRETISRESGVPEKKLTGKVGDGVGPIDSLVDRGLLTRERGGGQGRPTMYTFQFDAIPDDGEHPPRSGGKATTTNTPHDRGGIGGGTPPKSETKHPPNRRQNTPHQRGGKLQEAQGSGHAGDLDAAGSRIERLMATADDVAKRAGVERAYVELLIRNAIHLHESGQLETTIARYIDSGLRSAKRGDFYALLKDLRIKDKDRMRIEAARDLERRWWKHREAIAVEWVTSIDGRRRNRLVRELHKHEAKSRVENPVPTGTPATHPQVAHRLFWLLYARTRGFGTDQDRRSIIDYAERFSVSKSTFANNGG